MSADPPRHRRPGEPPPLATATGPAPGEGGRLDAKARAFLRRNRRWHAGTTAIAAAAAWFSGHPELAWSLAVGALLMYANLAMTTRALLRTFRTATESSQSPAGALSWTTRWPLVALALVGILWYMPARPEGIALGVAISLLSSVLAALGLPDADPHHG
ncbi:MAG: hypothetical protein B7733_03865 [Myxococcales bacterium FL481]|nr:MAG: hypothetical protein B7733_03865 [Myxococcales bacterium FL481]